MSDTDDSSSSRYNLRPRNRYGQAITAKALDRFPIAEIKPPKKRKRTEKSEPKRKPAKEASLKSSSRNSSPEENEEDVEEHRSNKTPRRVTPRPPPRCSRSVSPASRHSDDDDEDNYAPLKRIPKAKMEDLAGLDDLKRQILESVVWPFAHRKNAKALNMECPRGVLLTGRPGTGKTMLADAIVNEIRRLGRRVNYYQETGQCLSKYVGESEGHVRDLFQTAHENAPSVIFLDELDGLGRRRENTMGNFATSLMTTLLTEINNVQRGKVLLIAATNCEYLVDPAVIRKGRFDQKYHIPLPNPPALRQIFCHYMKKRDLQISEEDIDDIFEFCKDDFELTGSDIENLVAEINRHSINRVFPNGEWCRLPTHEVTQRLAQVKAIDFGRDIYPVLRSLNPDHGDQEQAHSEPVTDESHEKVEE